jgi:dynein heavy chain
MLVILKMTIFVLCFRFRGGIKDLEVMMQNVITSAFDTVTTVEAGVELLDIFMHLASREVIQPNS